MSLRLHEAPDVLAPQQVAELLGLGRTACYQALRNGDLPGTKVGGQWLVPKAKLLERLGLHDPGDDSAPDLGTAGR